MAGNLAHSARCAGVRGGLQSQAQPLRADGSSLGVHRFDSEFSAPDTHARAAPRRQPSLHAGATSRENTNNIHAFCTPSALLSMFATTVRAYMRIALRVHSYLCSPPLSSSMDLVPCTAAASASAHLVHATLVPGRSWCMPFSLSFASIDLDVLAEDGTHLLDLLLVQRLLLLVQRLLVAEDRILSL